MNGLRAFQNEMHLRFHVAGAHNEFATAKGLLPVPDAGNLIQFRNSEIGEALKEIG